MISELFMRIRRDRAFRIKMFLCLSLIFNLAYSVFMFLVGRANHSKWFFVMSIYYGLLCLARAFVLAQVNPRRHWTSKIKTLRVCGCFLLLINLAVSSMMFILIRGEVSVSHHEITVISLAAYTFATLTSAIVGSVRYIKRYDYVLSSVKLISLTSASVSMVTLTNTMLATFGEDNEQLRNITLPLLSAFVAVFIIVMAILMIRKANIDLRMCKNEKE